MIRLLYIGDLPIRSDQSGGSIVLWRHQQLLRSGTITETQSGFGYQPSLGATMERCLRRLRLSRLVLILQPWLRKLDVHIFPSQSIYLGSNADAILTVAHGLSWVEAQATATLIGKPLVTIVHDWYPDASGCPRSCLWIWEYYFRRLIHNSDLVLAVSEGMAEEIGSCANLTVLPPIPDPALKPSPPRQTLCGIWRLYYSGFCGGLYRLLLQQLIDAVSRDQRFMLHVSGSDQQGLSIPPDQNQVRSSGFLEGKDWQQAFHEADALMLILSFDRRHCRHLTTHFPSKLVEYANRGRPIVIWGPIWSSAFRWAKGREHVLCVVDASPSQLLAQIAAWLPLQPLQGPSAAFPAEVIASTFETAIHQMIHRNDSSA